SDRTRLSPESVTRPFMWLQRARAGKPCCIAFLPRRSCGMIRSVGVAAGWRHDSTTSDVALFDFRKTEIIQGPSPPPPTAKRSNGATLRLRGAGLGNGHGEQGIKPHTAVVRPKVLVLIVVHRTGTKAVMVPKWDPSCRPGLAAGLSQRGHP